MLDPALLLLLAGAASLAVQAVRGVLKGAGVGSAIAANIGVKIENGRVSSGGVCYAGVVLENLKCVYDARDYFTVVLERVLTHSSLTGLVVGKTVVDRAKLLSDIENRIMSLRVVLEREPGNKRVERKLRLLERMYSEMLSGRPAIAAGMLLVVKDDCGRISDTARSLASELSRTGCRARVVEGHRLIEALGLVFGLRRHDIERVLPARVVSDSLVGLHDAGLPASGVYIGRSRSGAPFTLPLWGKQGSMHYVVIGPTGRGKTTLASILLLRAEALGYHVYGVDPKGDMVYKLRGYLSHLEVKVPDAIQAAFWLYHEGMVDRSFVEKTLTEIGLGEAAHLIDEILEECSLARLSPRLSERVKRLGLRRVNPCEKPSWVKPGLVYDVSGLPETLRSAAMATISYLALYLGGSLLVVDEAWRLGRLASYHLVRLYKEARSRGLAVFAATQDPRDLPDEIYNNSYGVLLFGSNDERYIRELSMRLGLHESEERMLRLLGIGEVLVRLSGTRPEIVEVDASELVGG